MARPKPDYELIRRLEAEVEQDPEQLATLRGPKRPASEYGAARTKEGRDLIWKRLGAAWGLAMVLWVVSLAVSKETSGDAHSAFEGGWLPARVAAYAMSIIVVSPLAVGALVGVWGLAYYVIRGRPHRWFS